MSRHAPNATALCLTRAIDFSDIGCSKSTGQALKSRIQSNSAFEWDAPNTSYPSILAILNVRFSFVTVCLFGLSDITQEAFLSATMFSLFLDAVISYTYPGIATQMQRCYKTMLLIEDNLDDDKTRAGRILVPACDRYY